MGRGGRGGNGNAVRSCNAKSNRSKVMLNNAICAAASSGDIETLLELMRAKLPEMSLVNVSTALHRLARMAMEASIDLSHDVRVESSLRCAQAMFAQCSLDEQLDVWPRCMATIAWATARLQVHDSTLFSLIGVLAPSRLSSFKPMELANLLWSFAKLKLQSEVLFKEAQAYILANASIFSSDCLAKMAWSFATVQFKSCTGLLRLAADTIGVEIATGTVNSVTIESVAWALATMKVHPKASVMQSIGDHSLQILRTFKAHEVCITLWAFARLKVQHRALFAGAAALFRNSVKLQFDLHSQGISNLMWAFAKQSDEGLFAEMLPTLCTVCTRLLPQLKPQEMSAVVLSLSSFENRFMEDANVNQLFFEVASRYMSRDVLGRTSATSTISMLDACAKFAKNYDMESTWKGDLCICLVQACAKHASELDVAAALLALSALPTHWATRCVHESTSETMCAVMTLVATVACEIDCLSNSQVASLAQITLKLHEDASQLSSCLVAQRALVNLQVFSVAELHSLYLMCGLEPHLHATELLAICLSQLAHVHAEDTTAARPAQSGAYQVGMQHVHEPMFVGDQQNHVTISDTRMASPCWLIVTESGLACVVPEEDDPLLTWAGTFKWETQHLHESYRVAAMAEMVMPGMQHFRGPYDVASHQNVVRLSSSKFGSTVSTKSTMASSVATAVDSCGSVDIADVGDFELSLASLQYDLAALHGCIGCDVPLS